ncbi:MAG: thioredoxin fold domain-containing protein [Mycoplasmatales bacterium]
MKTIIIILSVALLVIIGASVGVGMQAKKTDLYAIQENVDYDEVLDDAEPTLYYYYQNTCHYCNNIKPQVKQFAALINKTDGINFKVVDMKDKDNTNAWYDWKTHNEKYGEKTAATLNPDYKSEASEMKTVDDIEITGTPSVVYVKDGIIEDYEVGKDVFKAFDKVEEEFGIDYTFDESQYDN